MSLPINNYELLICNNNLDYLLSKNQEANAISLLLIFFFVISNSIMYYYSNKIINNYISKIYHYNILLSDLNNRYDLELDLSDIKECVIEFQTRPEVESDEEEEESEEDTSSTNRRNLRSHSLNIKGNGWKLD